ncbi:MAG: hypothetical protein HKN62_16320 [Phycisphaerales bacterium]|nr:hypothetical protein [Phycisphaerales bacterium]
MLVNHNHLRAHGLTLLLGACGLGVLASPAQAGEEVKPPELFSHTNQDEFHHPIDPDDGHLIPGGGLFPEPRWLDILPTTTSFGVADGSEPHGVTGFDSPNQAFDFDVLSGIDLASPPSSELSFAGVAATPRITTFLTPQRTFPALDLTQSVGSADATGGGFASPIPTPGVLALLLTGAGLAAGRRRRRLA